MKPSLLVSCSAQCNLIGGKLCPSGNCRGCACTHDTYDNSTNVVDEEDEYVRSGMGCYTGLGSQLKFCENSKHRCNFCKHPCCCANYNCYKRRPNAYVEHCPNGYFEGNYENRQFSLQIQYLTKSKHHSGHNCPAPETVEHGTWDCKYLDAPMEFPITEGSTWTCELETARKSK